MNEDRIIGATRNMGGKVEEAAGRITGDAKSQGEGVVEQVAGTAQNLYGQAKDAASDVSDTIHQSAKYAQDHIRVMVEKRPYTVAVAALAMGWIIGRLGRND